MDKEEITYKITFNQNENKIKVESDTFDYVSDYNTPKDKAEMYRCMACHFLMKAHFIDHPNQWTIAVYYGGDQWEQIVKMLGEWYNFSDDNRADEVAPLKWSEKYLKWPEELK